MWFSTAMAPGPVVFLVLSHHNPPLVERLLARLADTETAVSVIHHDAKATSVPAVPINGRATLMPDPAVVGWGDMSSCDATLRAMHWIRDEIPDFSWIVLISGQDYPAMSCRQIEAELRESRADAFIHWEFVPPIARRGLTDWQRGTSHRYYWHCAPGTHRPIPIPRLRAYFDGLGVFAGSSWWNLGHRAVDRILDDPATTDYLRRHRFRTTPVPDEAFFHTTLLNSPQDLRLVNSHRRFYRFLPVGGAAHPETLTIHDLDEILGSGAFFVRKVDDAASGELLDELDRQA
jgi:hypothetical protein